MVCLEGRVYGMGAVGLGGVWGVSGGFWKRRGLDQPSGGNLSMFSNGHSVDETKNRLMAGSPTSILGPAERPAMVRVTCNGNG